MTLLNLQDTLNRELPSLLDTYGVPGIAIGVRVGDDVITLAKGVTSLAHPLPVDADTVFQIGSISKTFVGIIAAQLEQEGVLDLGAPVAPLLADLGPLDERITLEHLLTHSAGIDAQYMIGRARELLSGGADDSIQASIVHYANDPVMFPPGSDFSYSGPGFMVAGAVIERLLNQRWADILRERVLAPAGMDHTFTRADEVMTYKVAAPHDVTEGRPRLVRNEGWQLGWQLPGWDVPGGGVLSTVNELLKYADYAWGANPEYGFFRTLRNRGLPGSDIAYAWKSESRRGRRVVGHDGLTIGYSSRFFISPDERIAYVSLTNSLKGAALNTAVERLILDAVFGPEVDEASNGTGSVPSVQEIPALAGVYDCGFYGEVELVHRTGSDGFALLPLQAPRDAGGFVIQPPRVDALYPAGPNVLSSDPQAELPDSVVPYIQDAQGQVVALRIGERIARRLR